MTSQSEGLSPTLIAAIASELYAMTLASEWADQNKASIAAAFQRIASLAVQEAARRYENAQCVSCAKHLDEQAKRPPEETR